MRAAPRTVRARSPRRRAGSVAVWSALLLVVLIAMVGLVVDGGLMLASHRGGQNAADAAALAAATDLMLGRGPAQATATATAFVTDPARNNFPDATVTVHIPPASGPYAGVSRYAEVLVTRPVAKHFILVLPGFGDDETVTARAVAGFEMIAVDEGVIALDPTARPGLRVTGGAILQVNGGVQVNSGVASAAEAKGGGVVMAADIEVVGGVNDPAGFVNIDPNDPTSPLHTGALPGPDLFGYLPTPTVANGVDATSRGKVKVTSGTSGTVTLSPGVYEDIQITGGTVVFQPGIYVLPGTNLQITGGSVTGNGVMFYMTGNTYNPYSGAPDASDPIDPLNQSPPSTPGTTFGTVRFNSSAHLSPIDTAAYTYSNPAINAFDGMLFYFRRANTSQLTIEGNAQDHGLTGTIYSKWGMLNLAGKGTYDAQFAVGKMDVTGQGAVTINYVGSKRGKAPKVFLVE